MRQSAPVTPDTAVATYSEPTKVETMKKLIQTTSGIIILFLAQSVLACDYPKRVDIPNGATAAKEDMLTGVKDVEEFKADMQAYLTCILDEEKAALTAIDDLQPEVEQQREEMLNKKYNAAVEDEEKVVARFNAEIRDFKAANE